MRSKSLFLTPLLALLLIAAFATSAQAKLFNAEIGTVNVKGTAEGETKFVLEGLAMGCSSAEYTGSVSSAVKEMEVSPALSGCVAFGFISTTINFEGCKFRFDASTTDVDVVCPVGKVIKAVGGPCEVQIGPQEGKKTITYLNKSGPPKTVSVQPAVEGIVYNKTKDGFGCPLNGTGTKSDGQLTGNVSVTGFQGAKQVGIFVDPAGVFNAEVDPISVVGSQEEPFIFTIENGMGIECKSASYTAEVNKAVEQLEVLPSYSECNIFGAPASVSMEGCRYRFNASTNDVDLVCPAGKVVKAVVGTCEVQFSSQENLKSVTYVNNAGPPKTVTVEAAVTGIKYNKTKDGLLCPLAGLGEKEDGEFSGDTLVKGFKGEEQIGIFVD